MVGILFTAEGGKTSVRCVLLLPVECVSEAKQILFRMQRANLNSLKATVSIRKENMFLTVIRSPDTLALLTQSDLPFVVFSAPLSHSPLPLGLFACKHKPIPLRCFSRLHFQVPP